MTVIVLHDLGVPAAGSAWRAALDAVGIADVWAPDLPGHGVTPAPTGGNYTRLDSVYEIGRAVAAGLDLSDAVLVGIGRSGWAALVLAVAGQGRGLVLVDGLGTPWLSPSARGARRRAAISATSLDPAAMASPPANGLDPRIASGIPAHGDENLMREAAAAVEIPTLLIGAEIDAANALATAFSGGVTTTECAPEAETVAPFLADWLLRF